MPTSARLSGFTRLPLLQLHCNRVSDGPFFSALPEKNGEKRGAGRASYCALTRASFWPLRGLNALFGRKTDIFPIALASNIAYGFVGAPTSARWKPANLPQISIKMVRTARADRVVRPYKELQ